MRLSPRDRAWMRCQVAFAHRISAMAPPLGKVEPVPGFDEAGVVAAAKHPSQVTEAEAEIYRRPPYEWVNREYPYHKAAWEDLRRVFDQEWASFLRGNAA